MGLAVWLGALSVPLRWSGRDAGAPPMLRFAKAYGDSMVLQAAPKRSAIWGYFAPPLNESRLVSLLVTSAGGRSVFSSRVGIDADGKWLVQLPPLRPDLLDLTLIPSVHAPIFKCTRTNNGSRGSTMTNKN